MIKMTIWQTPAGIVDEGGMVLGAWLNFGLSLEAPPANGLMHVSLMQISRFTKALRITQTLFRKFTVVVPWDAHIITGLWCTVTRENFT